MSGQNSTLGDFADEYEGTWENDQGPQAHLQQTRPKGIPSEFEVSKPNEHWCGVCQNRISVSPTADREYGHDNDCKHWCGLRGWSHE